MFHSIPRYLRSGLILSAFVAALGLTPAAKAESPDGGTQATALPPQTDNQGQVSVKVTPIALSPTADSWRFEVELNTHVTPLDQDLTKAVVLTDANGHEQRPSAWQGDPPGGHHRKGVLVFPPIAPMPSSVTLKIGQIGSVPEQLFTWTLSKP